MDNKGKLIDFDVTAYSNCGHTFDLSVGVMRNFPNLFTTFQYFQIEPWSTLTTATSSETLTLPGKCAKRIRLPILPSGIHSPLPIEKDFRGFGGPQGMFCTETLMQHLAEELDLDPVKLREENMYEEGDCTPFGMHLNQCNIKRTWFECKESAEYEKRLEEVKRYNQ